MKYIFVLFLLGSFFGGAAQISSCRQLEEEWAGFQQADDNGKNFRLVSLLRGVEEVMQGMITEGLPDEFLPGWQMVSVPGDSVRIYCSLVQGEKQPARLLYCYVNCRKGEVLAFSNRLSQPYYTDSLCVSLQPYGGDNMGYVLDFRAGKSLLLEIPDLRVHILSEYLSRARNDGRKHQLAKIVQREAMRVMSQPRWFDDSFEGFDKISTVCSADGVLKVMTWNVENRIGKHFFYGVIGVKQKGVIKVFGLEDRRDQIRSPEYSTLAPSKWYGAIYYDMVSKRYKGKTYYTLLGYNGNDAFSRIRVVDVITLSGGGIPQLGASVFKTERRLHRRLIFEYSNQASMMLRYDDDAGAIVMDHLAPSDAMYQGNRHYYGPDMSVDALIFKKGQWNLSRDVDLRNR